MTSSKGFAYVVLEGPDSLIEWGVAQVSDPKRVRCLERVESLLQRYRPDALVLEDYLGEGSRRCRRVRSLIRGIAAVGRRHRLVVRYVSRAAVREAFADSGGTTKQAIATSIAFRFPELSPRLPPIRKTWMTEDERMNIFDAASFALTVFDRSDQRRSAGLRRAA